MVKQLSARFVVDEEYPAVAEPDVGYLHRHGYAVDQHHLFVGKTVPRGLLKKSFQADTRIGRT